MSSHHVGWFIMYTAGFEFLMRKLKKKGLDFTTPFLLSWSANNFRKALSIFSLLLLYSNSLNWFFLHFNFATLFAFLFYPFFCKGPSYHDFCMLLTWNQWKITLLPIELVSSSQYFWPQTIQVAVHIHSFHKTLFQWSDHVQVIPSSILNTKDFSAQFTKFYWL